MFLYNIIGLFFQAWKVKKALKITMTWTGIIPKISVSMILIFLLISILRQNQKQFKTL